MPTTQSPTRRAAPSANVASAPELDRRANVDEAESISGWDRKSIKRGVELRIFPPPVGYLGIGTERKRPQWLLSDLQRWVRGEWTA